MTSARPRVVLFGRNADDADTIAVTDVLRQETVGGALMLVAAGRGVAVMPDWVLRAQAANPELAVLPLGPQGVLRRLHAALRAEDLALPYMAHVLRLARTEPMRLMRAARAGGI